MSAPASQIFWISRSGSATIRWASIGSPIQFRTSATTYSANVTRGTKCPSMTSTENASTPAAATRDTSCSNREKSASSMEAAMIATADSLPLGFVSTGQAPGLGDYRGQGCFQDDRFAPLVVTRLGSVD